MNSYLGWATFADKTKIYDLYFNSVVTGIKDNHLVIFLFDIISFDIYADASFWLYLEELVVEEASSVFRQNDV